ncbi:MAG: hypothetical protein KatS3mg129_1710 [Leptospiraceae bacterium]|nr:MAG: hypothetical protein KatS3mg129_1710 [Leptospiraceae bacterium]
MINSILYAQEEVKDTNKEKQEYIASYEKQQKLLNTSIEQDFKEKIKIALELEKINPEMAIQRYWEIIYLYPEQFKEINNQEKILTSLLNLYKIYKNTEEFFALLEYLKEMELLNPQIEEKIKQHYQADLTKM